MNTQAKTGGNPSHKLLYAKVAAKSDLILKVLFDLLEHKNENVRLGAAKTLVNKLLPDLKQTDVDIQGKIEQIIITRITKPEPIKSLEPYTFS